MRPTIDFLIQLAKDSGAVIRDAYYKHDKHIEYKLSSADLVTETDIAVEKLCIERIKKQFPGHSFVCEESEHDIPLGDGPTWCIDPIDGTMNFVHSFPLTAISIGYVEKKIVQMGVIYNPIMDELFYAERGSGAWLIQKDNPKVQLKVSPKRLLLQSVILTGYSSAIVKKTSIPSERANLDSETLKAAESITETSLANHKSLLFHARDLRRMGSCACDMAWVAAGRADAMAEIGVKEWDVAGGVVIVEEAGGYCCNYDGQRPVDITRRQIIAASSEQLAGELVDILQGPRVDMKMFG